MKFSVKSLVCLGFFIVFCCACVSRDVYRGHELTRSLIAKLQVHKSTKDDVVDLVGHPSFSSTFDDNVWYYVNMKRIGVSPFNKGVSSHKVLELRFKNNILDGVTMREGSKVTKDFNSKKTYIQGDDTSSLKDFVRNLGKFNQKKDRAQD